MIVPRKFLAPIVAMLSTLTLVACLPAAPETRSPDASAEPTDPTEVQCSSPGIQPGAENEPDQEESPLEDLLCSSWSATVIDSGVTTTGWYFQALFQNDGTVEFESAPTGDFVGPDATGAWELTGNQLAVELEGIQSLVAEGETIDIDFAGEFDGSALSLEGEGSDGLTYMLSAAGLVRLP